MRFDRRGASLFIVIAMISAGVACAEKRTRVGGKAQKSVAATTDTAGMEKRWQEIQTILRPDKLLVASDQFLREFPASPYGPQVRVIQAGVRQAIDIQRSAGLSGDLFEDAVGDSAYREHVLKAVRGDKDAAYRIALGYKTGTLGVGISPRRREQWLRFSAELGNGVASWELAEIYNNSGLVADAARFEKKALDLGYQPPIRLPSRGY
jgi:hypothetical protein